MLFAGFTAAVDAQTLPAKVAIIIDDIGYQKADPLLIQLPYALTFAVMPFAPQSQQMAELAALKHKEVMLHMPMEAVAQNHLLGKGALRRQMSKTQVQQALHLALAQVPQAIGVNNHMGSLYTSLPQQMDWTMQVMAERGLYFIDSKTTARSAVARATTTHQIKSRSRDIFLDNDKSHAALDKQFNQLIKLAKQQGSAVAIGHPYPETYRYLKRNLARLAASGVELVPASQLLDLPPVSLAAQQGTATPKTAAASAANRTESRAANETNWTVKARSDGKKVVKLSPQPEKVSAVGEAGSGSVSLVHNTDSQMTNPTTDPAGHSAPVAEIAAAAVAEPLQWHPPYKADLPGFVIPAVVMAAEWQLWFEDQRAVATTVPTAATPLLLLR
ncbi:divergent polysaccharide deacetylase family protein [Rheinheimera riviphila]|uniref:Divergent polysaccharide deacetylase family protein n=1 Tax=Rheinheimera riviphila TaxID=1834037 RepID=A0A437R0K1_9GAMM|nr:divergent polysaccharide deacetylase family protein [Rheinheimera riviphila]RVU40289.1 divergent polysaccharide deacetylase family protein [Rheinheimera riviphila]